MNRRVMLIDDDTLVTGLSRALQSLDVQIVAVATESQAVAHALAARPDALVLGEHPGRPALAICDRLAKNRNLAGIPIIVLASASTEDAVAKHRQSKTPAREYLRRPVDADALAETLRVLLGLESNTTVVDDIEMLDVPTVAVLSEPPARARTSRAPAERKSKAKVDGASTDGRSDRRSRPSIRPGRKSSDSMRAVPDPARESAAERAEITELRRRAIELEEMLASARRERDEGDANWSEWVTSAEQFANEVWSEREQLRKVLDATQRELADVRTEATGATQREGAARARIDALAAQVNELRQTSADRSQTLSALDDNTVRAVEESAQLRRQLADAMARTQRAESERGDARLEADRLRATVAEIEARASAQTRPPDAVQATDSEREQLRKNRELLAAEQKRAVGLMAELTAARREADGRLKTARAEASTALQEARARFAADQQTAREEAERRNAELRDAQARAEEAEARASESVRAISEQQATIDGSERERGALRALASEHETRATAAERQLAEVQEQAAELHARVLAERSGADDLRKKLEGAAAAEAALRTAAEEARAASRAETELHKRAFAEQQAREARALHEVSALTEQLESARRGAGMTTSQLRQEHQAALAAVRAERDKALEGLKSALAERDLSRQRAKDLEATVSDHAGSLAALKERLAGVESERNALGTHVERERVAAREALAAAEARAADATRDREVVRQTAEKLAGEQRAAFEQRMATVRSESDALRTELAAQVDKSTALLRERERDLTAARSQVTDLEQRLAGAATEIEKAGASRAQIVQSLDRELQEVDQVRRSLETERASRARLEVDLGIARQTLEAERTALAQRLEDEAAQALERIERARKTADEESRGRDERIAAVEHERDTLRRQLAAAAATESELRASARAELDRVQREAEERAKNASSGSARQVALAEAERDRAATVLLQLRTELDALGRVRDEQDAALRDRQAALDSLRDEMRAAKAEWDVERSHFDHTVETGRAARERAVQSERQLRETHVQDLELLRRELEEVLASRRALAEHAEGQQRTLQARETDLGELRSALAAVHAELDAVRTQTGEQLRRVGTDAERLQAEVVAGRAETARLEEEIRASQARERDLARMAQRGEAGLRASYQELAGQANALRAQCAALTDEVEQLRSEREGQQLGWSLRERELGEQAQRVESLGTMLADVQRERDEIARELETSKAERARIEQLRESDGERARDADAERQRDLDELSRSRQDGAQMAELLRSAQGQVDEMLARVRLSDGVNERLRKERNDAVRERSAHEALSEQHEQRRSEVEQKLSQERARVLELEQRLEATRREHEARVELLRAQSNTALKTLRSRVDGESEKTRKRFDELSEWVTDAERRAAEAFGEIEHERRLRAKAERSLAEVEKALQEAGRRLATEQARAAALVDQVAVERARMDQLQALAQRLRGGSAE